MNYGGEVDKVVVRGSDNLSLSRCYYEYINRVMGLHVSWTADQLETKPIEKEFEAIELEQVFEHSYYLNVCTFSYSMAWWDAKRWRREVDYMAMKGVDIALAFTGQEYVWLEAYRRLGLSE